MDFYAATLISLFKYVKRSSYFNSEHKLFMCREEAYDKSGKTYLFSVKQYHFEVHIFHLDITVDIPRC